MQNRGMTLSEGQKNLVNSENKENLPNYQLLRRKPYVCSTSQINHCRSIFFSRNTGSAMVAIKFWRGKF